MIKPKQILANDPFMKTLQREFGHIKFLINQFFSNQSFYWPDKEIKKFKKLLVKGLSENMRNKKTYFQISTLSSSFYQLLDTWQRWLKEKEMGKFSWDIKRAEFKKSLQNFENASKTEEFKIRKTLESLFIQFKNLGGNSSFTKEQFVNRISSIYTQLKSQNPHKKIKISIQKKGDSPTIRAEVI